MIYIWLKYTKKMLSFETHEDFDRVTRNMMDIYNLDGIIVFVEPNTKQWND